MGASCSSSQPALEAAHHSFDNVVLQRDACLLQLETERAEQEAARQEQKRRFEKLLSDASERAASSERQLAAQKDLDAEALREILLWGGDGGGAGEHMVLLADVYFSSHHYAEALALYERALASLSLQHAAGSPQISAVFDKVLICRSSVGGGGGRGAEGGGGAAAGGCGSGVPVPAAAAGGNGRPFARSSQAAISRPLFAEVTPAMPPGDPVLMSPGKQGAAKSW